MKNFPSPFTLVADTLDCAVTDVSAESELGELPEWDSMGHLNIMMALEDQYGITLNEKSVEKYRKMENIINLYNELVG